MSTISCQFIEFYYDLRLNVSNTPTSLIECLIFDKDVIAKKKKKQKVK